MPLSSEDSAMNVLITLSHMLSRRSFRAALAAVAMLATLDCVRSRALQGFIPRLLGERGTPSVEATLVLVTLAFLAGFYTSMHRRRLLASMIAASIVLGGAVAVPVFWLVSLIAPDRGLASPSR
jgi:hypothetical protein